MADRVIAMMVSEPFVFHGRSLAVFDHFDATPAEAEALTRTRYAVIRTRRYQTADLGNEPVVKAPEPTPEPTTKRRRYKRRDLIAEKG